MAAGEALQNQAWAGLTAVLISYRISSGCNCSQGVSLQLQSSMLSSFNMIYSSTLGLQCGTSAGSSTTIGLPVTLALRDSSHGRCLGFKIQNNIS